MLLNIVESILMFTNSLERSMYVYMDSGIRLEICQAEFFCLCKNGFKEAEIIIEVRLFSQVVLVVVVADIF